jgi:hypothetical protein
VRDRIRACSLAAMLSTLFGFVAMHQTQAQNPRIGWTFLTGSASNSLELAASLGLVAASRLASALSPRVSPVQHRARGPGSASGQA